MRQAIEEGFILDVLRNYTSYAVAFKLAHAGAEHDSTEVERSAALKRLMGWVKLHPYNVAQKVAVVVEHFRARVAPLLGGRAKAMVVVGSRVEAVRWKLAIDRYIASKGYPIGTLVAFSGEIDDAESSPDPLSENSKLLNPRLAGRDIREAFKGDDYRILLAANKFQTGFDQPLLCGMYVDKRLAGIQAVQTLSRLNRAHPGKDTTFVLDFVNDPAEVLAAFQTYYETATLETTTDPNLVFDLRAKLDATGHYDEPEVERVVRVELDPRAKQGDLVAALEPVYERVMKRHRAAREALVLARQRGDAKAAEEAQATLDALTLFRADMGAYLRLYTFLSQIFDYGQTALEKRALFYKRLIPLLEFERERSGIDLSKVQLTHHALKDKGTQALGLASGQATPLPPITEAGAGAVREKEKAYLAELIERINELFSGELSDSDKLVYVREVLRTKLLDSALLQQQAASNTVEQFRASPDLSSALESAIMDAYDAHTTMSQEALSSKTIRAGLLELLLDYTDLYAELKERAKRA
jgi:type I restriction enzyme R subunit